MKSMFSEISVRRSVGASSGLCSLKGFELRQRTLGRALPERLTNLDHGDPSRLRVASLRWIMATPLVLARAQGWRPSNLNAYPLIPIDQMGAFLRRMFDALTSQPWQPPRGLIRCAG